MMKAYAVGALGCACVVAAAFATWSVGNAGPSDAARVTVAAPVRTAGMTLSGTPPVVLTLSTRPLSAQITQGDGFVAQLAGSWQAPIGTPVYLQASDSAGNFSALAPMPAGKLSKYSMGLALPTSTAAATYSGQLTVRACADALCQQPYADTMHSISYTIVVKSLGEWETLQRTSRHDGYVPVTLDASRYRLAWSWRRPSVGELSPVVTDGHNVYFSETGRSASLYALRAADGVPQWRRVFSVANALNPPTVSNGVVYAATTGHEETWLYALQGSDGLQAYQSKFFTQWATILNPTVRNGRVYVNSGYYGGVVYAFNLENGVAAWSASGGTYGENTPAVDDESAYVYNGTTLSVLKVSDGTLSASIGPNPDGVQTDYFGTPMLGSADHVLAYSGTAYNDSASRQLVDFSVARRAARWMSFSLYSNYPAVAKGVVYATSNESHTFDALDEATGRLMWSWKPAEQGFTFIGNVVVTDNVAFVSTATRIYALDLRSRKAIWSAPTPGTMSLSADRMLFVSKPAIANAGEYGAITAYRLE